jgi:hypothetical protein
MGALVCGIDELQVGHGGGATRDSGEGAAAPAPFRHLAAHPEIASRPPPPLLNGAPQSDAALARHRHSGAPAIGRRAAVHTGAAIDQRAAISEAAAVGGSV